jgi:hypothetical protein
MALQPYPAMNGGPEQVTHRFRFQVNATSDPDNIVGAAQAVTDIVRDDVGEFSLTFAHAYPTFVSASFGRFGSGEQAQMIEVLSYTASTGVLVIQCLSDAGAAEEPTDDDWITCDVTFCRRQNLAPSASI